MNHHTFLPNIANALLSSAIGHQPSTAPQSPDNKPLLNKPKPESKAPAPVGTLLSDVRGKKVRWLWQHRLPLGKLTTLEGDRSLGKSHLALDIAARVSSGREMPDGTPGITGGAGVVLIAPKDRLDDTIHPRLQRAGADLSRIVSIGHLPVIDPKTGESYERPFQFPHDIEMLVKAIQRVRAKLVIIDPLAAIFSNKGLSKDSEAKLALMFVETFIERAGIACLIVHHPIKAGSCNPPSCGSMTLLEAAHSGLIVLQDPTDEHKRVLAHTKSNLSAPAVSLSFSIVSDEPSGDDRSFLHWQGECPQTLQELLHPPVPVVIQPLGTARQDILSVLEEYAPEALSVKALAEELPQIGNGHLRKTLKRMAEDGQIKKSARGEYCAFSPSSPSPEQQDPSVPTATTATSVPSGLPEQQGLSATSGTLVTSAPIVPSVPNDPPEHE